MKKIFIVDVCGEAPVPYTDMMDAFNAAINAVLKEGYHAHVYLDGRQVLYVKNRDNHVEVCQTIFICKDDVKNGRYNCRYDTGDKRHVHLVV
tara:strand:+ start:65 stop:340 length:276 start_codon:yes stop_codon:yes gene_type:complete